MQYLQSLLDFSECSHRPGRLYDSQSTVKKILSGTYPFREVACANTGRAARDSIVSAEWRMDACRLLLN